MSIEVPLGGQWEILGQWHNDALTNGYTQRFSADGRIYRLLRYQLTFAGQTIGIAAGPLTTLTGAINKHKHDGTGAGTSHNPNGAVNTLYEIVTRGTGGVQGYAMPRRGVGGAAPGWLLCFSGYSTVTYPNPDQWEDASGDYFSFDGRVMCQKNGAPSNDWTFDFGFGSHAGQSGSYSLLVEGLRG